MAGGGRLRLAELEPGDVDGLRAAWEVLGPAFEPPLWERVPDYDGYVRKVAERGITLLAMDGDEVVGGISFYANDAEGRRAFITEVMAAPGHQGEGIGSTLLAACDERSAAEGMESIGLEVRKDNPGARRLYERVGYRETEERELSWIMDKPLP